MTTVERRGGVGGGGVDKGGREWGKKEEEEEEKEKHLITLLLSLFLMERLPPFKRMRYSICIKHKNPFWPLHLTTQSPLEVLYPFILSFRQSHLCRLVFMCFTPLLCLSQPIRTREHPLRLSSRWSKWRKPHFFCWCVLQQQQQQ